MFKMGRSPRVDSNDNQPQGLNHTQPQPFNPPAAQAAVTVNAKRAGFFSKGTKIPSPGAAIA